MVKIEDTRLMLFSSVENIATQHGFKQRKQAQSGGLIKITKPITICVGWSILDYGETKKFLGMSALICHNEVREITLPILKKYRLMGASASIKDWSPTFHPPEGIPKISLNELSFQSLNEIEFIKEIYPDFILFKALPYFEKWGSLLSVYDYIKDKSEDWEIGLGQFLHYEKAVIMRLCNDKNYQDYFYEYYKSKEMYHLNDPTNEDCLVYLNAAKEMLDQLDEIKPIYNL